MDQVGEDKSETKLKRNRVRQKVFEAAFRQKFAQEYPVQMKTVVVRTEIRALRIYSVIENK